MHYATGDVCRGGLCVGATMRECSDPHNPCETSFCTPFGEDEGCHVTVCPNKYEFGRVK